MMIGTLITCLALMTVTPEDSSSTAAAARILDRMDQVNERIAHMRCDFLMEITKDGNPLPLQRTIFRYRSHPEIIHLTFLEPHEGRVVRFSREGDAGTMRVRPDGFWHFMTFGLDPEGERAMEEAIDPITAQGFPNIVSAARRLLGSARSSGDQVLTVDTLSSIPDPVFRIAFRSAEEEVVLEVDARSFLPRCVRKKTGNNAAVYRYENVELNPAMKEADFEL